MPQLQLRVGQRLSKRLCNKADAATGAAISARGWVEPHRERQSSMRRSGYRLDQGDDANDRRTV